MIIIIDNMIWLRQSFVYIDERDVQINTFEGSYTSTQNAVNPESVNFPLLNVRTNERRLNIIQHARI